jgi:hypothetical protein
MKGGSMTADVIQLDEAAAADREDRIQRITEEVAKNAYSVEPKEVATAILRHSYPELYRALVTAGEVEE